MSELILPTSYYVNRVQTLTDVLGTYFVIGNTAQQDVLVPVTYEVMDVPWRDLKSQLEIINRADQQSTIITRRTQRNLARYTVAQPPAFETVLYPDRDLLIRRDFPRIAWANLEHAALRTDWYRRVITIYSNFYGSPMDLALLHFDLSLLGPGKRIVGAELRVNQLGYVSPQRYPPFYWSTFKDYPCRFNLVAVESPIPWDKSSTWQTFVDIGVPLDYSDPFDLSYWRYQARTWYKYPDLADNRFGIVPTDSQELSVVLAGTTNPRTPNGLNDAVTKWYEYPDKNLGIIIGAGGMYDPRQYDDTIEIVRYDNADLPEDTAVPLKLNIGLSANSQEYYRPKLIVRWQYADYSQTVFDFGASTTVRLSAGNVLQSRIKTGVTSNLDSTLRSSLPNLRSRADVYIPDDIDGKLYVNLRGLDDKNSLTRVSQPSLPASISAQRGWRSNLDTHASVRKTTQDDFPAQVSVRVGDWQEIQTTNEVPPHSNFPTRADVSVPDLFSQVTSVESSYLNSRIDIMTDGKDELPAQTDVHTYPGTNDFSSQVGVQWKDEDDLAGQVRAWIVSGDSDVDSLTWVPRRINRESNLTSKLIVYPYDPSGAKGSNLISRLQPKPPYVGTGWLDGRLFVMSANTVIGKIGVRRWKYLYSRLKIKTNAQDSGVQGQITPRVYNVGDMLTVMLIKNGTSDLNSQMHAGPYTITSGTTVYSWPPVGEHDEPGGGS